MTTLSITKPYGTYQRVSYQTVDLEPLKKLCVAMLKLVAVLLIVLAAFVVAVTLFQMIVVASQFVIGWFAVHGWQVGLTVLIFTVAWKVKP